MIPLKKINFFLGLSSCVLIFCALPAFSWQLTLSDVDGDLTAGQSYEMTVAIEADPADYLDVLYFAIQWDTDLLQIAEAVDRATYKRGTFPTDYTLWGPTNFPTTIDGTNGLYLDVSSSAALGRGGEFMPEATGETLMATFTFNALQTGAFTDMASFYFTPETNLTELVNISGTTFNAEDGQLQISKIGSASVMAPVPIPAGIWLLASGLLGIICLRRRRS